ncbi:GGDEF domain-containing protein [Marinobacter sp. 2_MG-2023]|uniref:sensor domain-containing diguanylate cyclase n=1 Tax=Marinobacter sp. 2_MG-2023 TaxID=3062679 RepID=UPI0026E48614|nr:GGDEF domain-containing protein [Marinobacter sp. 2_MG-2023]MDO6443324.1 GGDEF domain-containing protein [Marinobacter sp. 2_MG-2023]
MTTRDTKNIIPSRSADPDVSGQLSVAGLQTILDNLDALVYVADFDTYELLYINAYGRRIWGEFQKGGKCWKVLQNNDGPCSFCTNSLLIKNHNEATGTHVWEFQNEVSKHWYQCRDQAIEWTDGRLVRLEIATDITDRKNMELALRSARQQAEAASRQDELTLLNNRRAFFQFGEQLLKQARRQQTPLAVIMFDLDHFKQTNDSYGHEAGDAVLRAVGRLLMDKVRESDVAARIGGEEFAVLLPDTPLAQAVELAERLRFLLQELRIRYRKTELRQKASFGVATLSVDDDRLEALLSRADEAMYLSKTRGRDRVHTFSQL